MHVVQRGINRQATFCTPRDFRSYVAALSETSVRYGVHVHAYALMTNHAHLLLTGYDRDGISRLMQQLGRKYVTYFYKANDRTGTLWEGRFRSSVVLSIRYLFACLRYIELNPVRAGLVPRPSEYSWSSYRHNALGHKDACITPCPEWLALGANDRERRLRYVRLFEGLIDSTQDEIVRTALRKGRPLE